MHASFLAFREHAFARLRCIIHVVVQKSLGAVCARAAFVF